MEVGAALGVFLGLHVNTHDFYKTVLILAEQWQLSKNNNDFGKMNTHETPLEHGLDYEYIVSTSNVLLFGINIKCIQKTEFEFM